MARTRAWVVLVTVYLGAAIISFSIYVCGVLYVALLEQYREGEAKTSLISTICFGLLCFGAPVGGLLNNRISCRFSIVFGAILAATGFLLSAFMMNINALILTLGVCTGFGFAIYSSGLTCVVRFYFEKHRSTVVSCYSLVVGAGMFVSTPACIYLIENFGLSMTFSILGCLQLQVCVIGALCRPSAMENKVFLERKKLRTDTHADGSLTKKWVDCSVMLNKSFLLFLIGVASWSFSFTAVSVHFPNYVRTTGGSDQTISYLMMSFSVANVVGRLMGSLMVSKCGSKCLLIQTVGMGVSAALTIFFWLYADVAGGALVFAVQIGLLTGIPSTTLTPSAIKFVGVNRLTEAYSFSFVFVGIGMSGAPLILGFLYASTGSYANSFILSGVMLGVACLWTLGAIAFKQGIAAVSVDMDVKEEDELFIHEGK